MNDAYYENVSLLLPMNGADGGTEFIDYSPNQKTVTAYGNAHTETDQSKYYGSSGYFDGSGDYLIAQYSTDFVFGTGDFTIEFWVYRVGSGLQILIDFRPNNGAFPLIYLDGSNTILFYANTSNMITGGTLAANSWIHVALSRASGNTKMFIDGTQAGSTWADSTNYSVNSSGPRICKSFDNYYFNGYLQDLRITKGVARYTSNFTPPAKLCGTISGTVTGADGNPAQRTIIAVPRSYPNTRVVSTQSSAVDGSYSVGSR
jgi:hypothetical protein